MSSQGICHKTEKGRTEIATHANKLGLRERTMLIMVDDKTTRDGLLSKKADEFWVDVSARLPQE